MNCSACNSSNTKLASAPEPVTDMPPGIFAANVECCDCGVILPMAFTQKEVEEMNERKIAPVDLIIAERKIALSSKTELYQLHLTLIGLPKRPNQSSGASWHSRHRESQRWHKRVLGRMLLERKSPPPAPLKRAQLTLIRHSSRAPDYDGLVHSFKPVVDALKKCLVISDDNMGVIGRPDYKWEKAGQKAGKIEIRVLEIAS